MSGERDAKGAVGVDTDHDRIEETREALEREKRPAGGLAAEAQAHRDRSAPAGPRDDDIRHDAADRGISAAVASRHT